jgi:hypothetical protein
MIKKWAGAGAHVSGFARLREEIVPAMPGLMPSTPL